MRTVKSEPADSSQEGQVSACPSIYDLLEKGMQPTWRVSPSPPRLVSNRGHSDTQTQAGRGLLVYHCS